MGFTFICLQRSGLARAQTGLQPGVILVGEPFEGLWQAGGGSRRSLE